MSVWTVAAELFGLREQAQFVLQPEAESYGKDKCMQQGRSQSYLTNSFLGSAIFSLALCLLFTTLAVAQTAHSNGAVTTLVGGSVSAIGVAVDGSGNIFVADYSNNAVKKMPITCGSSACVTTLGGGFYFPSGVTVDSSGNVFIADTSNKAAKEMPADCASSSCVRTLGGGFYFPMEVAVDSIGNVFVADDTTVNEILHAARFPITAVGSTSSALTFYFTFDAGGQIGAPRVLTQGATGLDFTDVGTGSCTTNGTTHTYSAGDMCTVDVQFKPLHPGARMGAVELTTTSGAQTYHKEEFANAQEN